MKSEGYVLLFWVYTAVFVSFGDKQRYNRSFSYLNSDLNEITSKRRQSVLEFRNYFFLLIELIFRRSEVSFLILWINKWALQTQVV